MDLELSDEQRWLTESVEALLTREWRPPAGNPLGDELQRAALWARLADFGALAVGGEEGLGAIELCLVARALGEHLAPVPYTGSAALRFAVAPFADELPGRFGALAAGGDAVATALLEPGSGWTLTEPRTTIDSLVLDGRKAAVEHAGSVPLLAVLASGAGGGVALALVGAAAPGVVLAAQPSFDPTTPLHEAVFEDVGLEADAVAEGGVAAAVVDRLVTIGTLLAAAEAVGAAGLLLRDACAYAAERRQFGRPIGSFQALRHLLADMYVREASSWSSVLYAAAALDEDADEARRTAAIAKAYVSRAAKEVAHGAIQVFGGIAITDEHPAHRYLRRIVVRERQFGDAAHHERALGRALAAAAVREPAGAHR
jgi:alkylation response protein AidB-like acyl-CoA dehydrogenase